MYDIVFKLFQKISSIFVGGKSYLITAESDRPWFCSIHVTSCEQDYITNVYEIV